MLTALLFLGSMLQGSDTLDLTLVPSGISAKVGGYMPMRSEFCPEPRITAKPKGLVNPHYGMLQIGKNSFVYILDEPEGKDSKLYVDTNNDRDLTNDPPTVWKPRTSGTNTMFMGSALVDIGWGRPVSLGVYRFDPKDPARAQLKDTLLFYTDFGSEIKFKLDGKQFSTFISGEPTARTMFPIDRNGDGQISQRY